MVGCVAAVSFVRAGAWCGMRLAGKLSGFLLLRSCAFLVDMVVVLLAVGLCARDVVRNMFGWKAERILLLCRCAFS